MSRRLSISELMRNGNKAEGKNAASDHVCHNYTLTAEVGDRHRLAVDTQSISGKGNAMRSERARSAPKCGPAVSAAHD
jgi:hypothetical protein